MIFNQREETYQVWEKYLSAWKPVSPAYALLDEARAFLESHQIKESRIVRTVITLEVFE